MHGHGAIFFFRSENHHVLIFKGTARLQFKAPSISGSVRDTTTARRQTYVSTRKCHRSPHFLNSEHNRSCAGLRVWSSREDWRPNHKAPGGTKLACMPGLWEPRWHLYEHDVYFATPLWRIVVSPMHMSCRLVKWTCPLEESIVFSFSRVSLALCRGKCGVSREAERGIRWYFRLLVAGTDTGKAIAQISA